VIEPMLKPQWYVKCDNMAAQAKAIVDSGQLRIIPDMHIKTWHRWMDGSRCVCVCVRTYLFVHV
jgi:valyl-tRNA synthetase